MEDNRARECRNVILNRTFVPNEEASLPDLDRPIRPAQAFASFRKARSHPLQVWQDRRSHAVSEGLRTELDELSRRMRPALTAFFVRRVQNRHEAEDLVQDVFIRIARSDLGGAAPDSYVFAIAANLLRDKARADRVRHDYAEARRLEDYTAIEMLDPHRVTAGRQDLQTLAVLIAGLPEKTRRIFTLYRIEHIDKRVIAENFGLSRRMVEIHIQTALVALARGMEGNP